MEDLKNKIHQFVQKEDFSVEDLIKILSPITNYIDDHQFEYNLNKIIEIIITDRNGDLHFDLRDLELLASDFIAISSIVSAVILALMSIPNMKFKYNTKTTEELIFKLLIYIFLILVPSKINKKISVNEKEQIVDLVLNIYKIIITSGVVKQLYDKIKAFFQKKGWCKCICGEVSDKQAVFEKQLLLTEIKISNDLNKHKDTVQLEKELQEIKEQLALLQN